MFREDYIRDNELIKPDDEFLEKLKERVSQEEKIIHIGDYTTMQQDEKEEKVSAKKFDSSKKLLVAAACIAVVCAAALFAGNSEFLENESGMRANVESAFQELQSESEEQGNEKQDAAEQGEDTTEVTEVSKECFATYQTACDLFRNYNVRIYQTESFEQMQGGVQYLQTLSENALELGREERDQLVGSIVNSGYILVETTESFENSKYYIAEFENDSIVCFVIGDEELIYIEELSGVQSLAMAE